jgi:transposase
MAPGHPYVKWNRAVREALPNGQNNDFRDAEAVAEAVQRPTMRFVPTKSVDHLDLQALHRVRSRLVSQRTAIVNQIRAFLLERGGRSIHLGHKLTYGTSASVRLPQQLLFEFRTRFS